MTVRAMQKRAGPRGVKGRTLATSRYDERMDKESKCETPSHALVAHIAGAAFAGP
jgi:hypothetical protein